MQIESRLDAVFANQKDKRKNSAPSHSADGNPISSEFKIDRIEDRRESILDLVSSSIVIGLTAQFVAFLFGLVTEFIPGKFENFLLSTFMGLCVAVIAYALMKDED